MKAWIISKLKLSTVFLISEVKGVSLENKEHAIKIFNEAQMTFYLAMMVNWYF